MTRGRASSGPGRRRRAASSTAAADEPERLRITILGYGQLGRALAEALAARGGHEVRVWTRNLASRTARLSRPRGVTWLSGSDLGEALSAAEIVFLAVRDDALDEIVSRLAAAEVGWRGKTVLHASGSRSPSALESLRRRGAAVAVCHPLRAFPAGALREQVRRRTPRRSRVSAPRRGSTRDSSEDTGAAERFAGALFAIEGTSRAQAAARRLIAALSGVALPVRIRDRASYHVAATVAANYGLALRDWACGRFAAAGLDPRAAEAAADQLMRNALDNALAAGGQLPITGPLRRGDRATVRSHLEALAGPERLAYAALGLLLLDRWERSAASKAPTGSGASTDPGIRRLLQDAAREQSG